MSEPVLITPSGLRKTLWRLVMHLNMGNVHVLNQEAIDYPGLMVSTSTDKRAKTSTRTFYVTGVDRAFDTIDAAAQAWNDLARAGGHPA